MDLADRGRGEGTLVELGEHALQRRAELLAHELLQACERHRRDVVAERRELTLQLVLLLLRKAIELGHRDHLADLHRRAAHPAELLDELVHERRGALVLGRRRPLALTRGTTRTPIDVALYAGRPLLARLPALHRRRHRSPAPLAGRLDPVAVGALLGCSSPARPARQGPVPRRPRRDLRQPDDHLPLPARQHDRRRPARLRLHLVGRGLLEAQPPLPVRGHGDDQQHALEPLAGGEATALPRPPRGPAALVDRARSPRTWAR